MCTRLLVSPLDCHGYGLLTASEKKPPREFGPPLVRWIHRVRFQCPNTTLIVFVHRFYPRFQVKPEYLFDSEQLGIASQLMSSSFTI